MVEKLCVQTIQKDAQTLAASTKIPPSFNARLDFILVFPTLFFLRALQYNGKTFTPIMYTHALTCMRVYFHISRSKNLSRTDEESI